MPTEPRSNRGSAPPAKKAGAATLPSTERSTPAATSAAAPADASSPRCRPAITSISSRAMGSTASAAAGAAPSLRASRTCWCGCAAPPALSRREDVPRNLAETRTPLSPPDAHSAGLSQSPDSFACSLHAFGACTFETSESAWERVALIAL